MKSALRLALAIAVAILAAWAGFQAGKPTLTSAPKPDAPDALARLLAAPYQDLTGRPQSWPQGEGKIRVINLWAAWCPPCRAEMPAFSRIQQQFADKNVQFIGLALDNPEAVSSFLRTTPVSYPVLIGSTDLLDLTASLGNTALGLPFTFILDAQGRQVSQKLGLWPEAELQAELQRLTAIPSPRS